LIPHSLTAEEVREPSVLYAPNAAFYMRYRTNLDIDIHRA
jgi:hypothetical protein